ncbi:MAG: putative 4-hydroxybenzoate polyprenyltransferase [Armatimonadetes bacterium]|nr:putative 4-hydroxybenzoate polyprenyltransferase [Armatimonadota bacterium]
MESRSSAVLAKVRTILEMIKFEHTIFALPFALTSAFLAANGMPSLWAMLWILVAMVGARSSAMAFNRIADLHYDRLNARTAGRALPIGAVRLAEVWWFTLGSAAVFVLASWMLNPLAFALSPVALLIVLGYSYTKRFTSLSHLVLGLALGIAPVGAWIAVTGRLDFAPMVLSAAVMFWTAGFDIIYSLQDLEFDRKQGLFSIPKALGPAAGLLVSRGFHLAAVLLLTWFGMILELGTLYWVGTALVAGLLAYEQGLVRPDDYSRVNVAFFSTNGLVSIGFLIFALVDLLVRRAA